MPYVSVRAISTQSRSRRVKEPPDRGSDYARVLAFVKRLFISSDPKSGLDDMSRAGNTGSGMKESTKARIQLAPPPVSVAENLRPELAILADGIAIDWVPGVSPFGCALGADGIAVDPRIAEPARSAVIHFALEWATWDRLDRRSEPALRAAHALAAAHATHALIDLYPRGEATVMRAGLPPALGRLTEAARASAMPADLARVLEAGVAGAGVSSAAAWSSFEMLKPVALPAMALMLRDGDNRLDLDPESGCNRYGGAPFPRVNTIEFSSSTASDLSPLALHAAEDARHGLMVAAAQGRLATALSLTADWIKLDLLRMLGLDPDESVFPVLAASGTTAMMIAAHIAAGGDTRPALAIVIGPEETGRGVPAAVVGRHAAPCAPTGMKVEQNGPVAGMVGDTQIVRLAIRNNQGRPLPPDTLAEPIAGIVARERAAGRRVVLYVVESSKTGLVGPGIAPVLSLRRWFPELPIVVDACQLRTGYAVLRRYLRAGCMVALTGSKFMGGPPFSGALLVPAQMFDGMAPLPTGFAEYSWRHDWPAEDEGRCGVLPDTGNSGLLLRWRGALAEMEAFGAIAPARVAAQLDEIGRAIRAALLAMPDVVPLPAVPATGADSEAWAGRPTIFTFAVRSRVGDGWLDEAQLRRLHILLASDITDRLGPDSDGEQRRLAARICHIGQPVSFATGPHPAGLRIAVGARRITATAAHHGSIEAMRRDVDEVLAKLRLLLDLGL